MTERRRGSLRRGPSLLQIGPSRLAWEDGVLTATVDEVTAPVPSRIQGTIRLYPGALCQTVFGLDDRGNHVWRPIAPRARVEVSMRSPAVAWQGTGYFDTNAGAEPLERGFTSWTWSRAHRPRDTLLFYDVERRGGGAAGLALRVAPDGDMREVEPPPASRLPSTVWRMPRTARGEGLKLRRTLEDTPFYARSMLEGRYDGEDAEIVHESLCLDRLRSPAVRAMLPFRMPRVLR
jgi:carotenoid 1,2-hydratase